LDIYDSVFTFAKQIPEVMGAVRQVTAIVGLFVFITSVRTFLFAQQHEKTERAMAWGGLFFSGFFFSVHRWMDIVSASFLGSNLGPVFMLNASINQTNDAEMIFEAFRSFINAAGWVVFILSAYKFYEAPKLNAPGTRRSAVWKMVLASCMVQLEITINILGATFGVDGAYKSIVDTYKNI
jgi:hypothetical protein